MVVKMTTAVDAFQGVSSDNTMKQNTSKTNEILTGHQSQPTGLPVPPRAAFQTREAASYIGVSCLTLKRLSYRKILHPNRATGRLLWPIKQLDEFLLDPSNSELR